MLTLPNEVIQLIDLKSSFDRAHWVDKIELLPKIAGVYVLNLQLPSPKTIKVGALGVIHFEAGCYIYVGSAMGSGGLSARIGRHFIQSNNKKKRWHIDYLRAEMNLLGCWIFEHQNFEALDKVIDNQRDFISNISECELAQAFIDSGYPAFKNMGSSDCKCLGHFMKVAFNV